MVDGTPGASASGQRAAGADQAERALDADVEARGAAIAHDVTERVASAIVLAGDWLQQQGNPLTQVQEIMLLRATLLSFSGLEERLVELLQEARPTRLSPGPLRLVDRRPADA